MGSLISIIGALTLGWEDLSDRFLIRSKSDYATKHAKTSESWENTTRKLNQRIAGVCLIIIGIIVIAVVSIEFR